jgi:hypothetical protein
VKDKAVPVHAKKANTQSRVTAQTVGNIIPIKVEVKQGDLLSLLILLLNPWHPDYMLGVFCKRPEIQWTSTNNVTHKVIKSQMINLMTLCYLQPLFTITSSDIWFGNNLYSLQCVCVCVCVCIHTHIHTFPPPNK